MIVWKGLGYLIAIIGFGSLVATEMVVEGISGSKTFYQENSWVIFVGMLVAAILTFALNKTVMSSEPDNHSLFFIATKWWPIVFLGLGILAPFV